MNRKSGLTALVIVACLGTIGSAPARAHSIMKKATPSITQLSPDHAGTARLMLTLLKPDGHVENKGLMISQQRFASQVLRFMPG